MRSLDLLLEHVREERQHQLQHFDALDGKAGILLGFAGAIVALAPTGDAITLGIGRLLAIISAASALAAFWPRVIPVTNLIALRDRYLSTEPAFTKLALMDTQIDMTGRSRQILRSKVRRLKIAMAALAVASVFTAVGVGLR